MRLIAAPQRLGKRPSRPRHRLPLFVLVSFQDGEMVASSGEGVGGVRARVNICRLCVSRPHGHFSSLFFLPPSLQPLIECYMKLKERGGTIGLRLTDTWLRHYQVRGGVKPGGFLLSRTLEK